MRNKILLFIALISVSLSVKADLVYQYDINSEINSTSWVYTKTAFKEAQEKEASLVIIKMNTYGGEVVFADSIRTAILNLNIPTVVFIDNNAASAGALISIACDKIYMKAGSTIGASTVVNGVSGEEAPDKYQSYMRAMMRATAESHGKDSVGRWYRNPSIAEAMVDDHIKIEGVVDSGKVLTFTALEAVENGYCEGVVEDVAEIIDIEGLAKDTPVVVYKPSGLDIIKGSLLGTALRSILIMLIFGGIFYELKTPGIGFPLLVTIIAAILYFAPLFIDGLATYWEIALFVIGLVLIFVEVFIIPGFGIAGVSGIIMVILGLMFSLLSNDLGFDFENFEFINLHWDSVGEAAFTVLFGLIASTILIVYLSSRIGASGLFMRLALQKSQTIEDGYISVEVENTDLIGKKAIVVSDLRPSGKIEIEGHRYDAISQNGYISKGSMVVIRKMRSGNVYVD